MADVWKHLFDSEWRQRQDIEHTAAEVAHTTSELATVRRHLRAAEARADRLELVLEGLLTLLEARGTLDREELAVWTTRLDLSDGVEDGRVGPDQAASAPKCPSCGRPVNPGREACLFCGAAVGGAAGPPAIRMVDCRRCGQPAREDRVYFTGSGMVCSDCYVP